MSEELLKSNRITFMESQAFQEFLTQRGIDLRDITTVRSIRAITLFRKILGIDINVPSAQSDLEILLHPPTTINIDPRFRKIVTEWSTTDEN